MSTYEQAIKDGTVIAFYYSVEDVYAVAEIKEIRNITEEVAKKILWKIANNSPKDIWGAISDHLEDYA